jgi:SAM-dependent methyltransferase
VSTPASVAEQFGSDAQARRVEALYLTPDIVRQREITAARLAVRAGERVLDVGCGPGLLVERIAAGVGEHGEARGVDVSATMVALARARCAGMGWARFDAADATALPFDDSHFDAVVCTQVLEYVPDIGRALDELGRVLRPGGRVLLVDTDWESCVWASGDDARMRRMLAAWNLHCAHPHLPRVLGPMLARHGFRIDSIESITIVNAMFDADNYSGGMMPIIAEFAVRRGGVEEFDARAWLDELHDLRNRGESFFSLDRHLFLASRSA